jgi:hypothetical protein
MAIASRKLCARATLVAALVVFAGIAAGQTYPCSGPGVPLFPNSFYSPTDQYTAQISAGVNIEGPTGTQICTMNVVAGQGQHYLWLRYTEFWFDTASGATGFLCGDVVSFVP